MTDIQQLSGNQLKVLALMRDLRVKYNMSPFPCSLHELMLTGLSIPTINGCRKALVAHGFVMEMKSGFYKILDPTLDDIPKMLGPSKILNSPNPEGIMHSSIETMLNSKIRNKGNSRIRNKGNKGIGLFKNLTPREKRIATARGIVERRQIVFEACRILGQRQGGDFIRMAMQACSRRMKFGATSEQLLAVVKYGRELWDKGDRWYKNLNLLHLWSTRNFSSYLAALQGKDIPVQQKDGIYRTNDPEWNKAFGEKVRRREREAREGTK